MGCDVAGSEGDGETQKGEGTGAVVIDGREDLQTYVARAVDGVGDIDESAIRLHVGLVVLSRLSG